jgi:hypothetical protein
MKEVLQVIKVTLSFLLLMMLCASVSNASDRSGTVSAQFLKIPLSARAVSMGGAQVAVAEGVSSIGFNPAGMMSVSEYAFGATYTSWFANIQHSYMGVVKNFPGIGALGMSLTLLTTDDMAVTTPSHPDGTGENFRASDYAFSVAYARQVSDKFMVGINTKVIKSYLYNVEIGASAFAFDIGTLYDIPRLHSRLGVSLTNIGKDVQYLNEPYSLPTALRFGILVDVLNEGNNQLKTTIQISRNNDTEEQYNAGAEYAFNGMVSLRAGYKFGYETEDVTAGFGANLNSLGINGTLDYGYNNFKFLPGTHSFTFNIQF